MSTTSAIRWRGRKIRYATLTALAVALAWCAVETHTDLISSVFLVARPVLNAALAQLVHLRVSSAIAVTANRVERTATRAISAVRVQSVYLVTHASMVIAGVSWAHHAPTPQRIAFFPMSATEITVESVWPPNQRS
jgi:hypothetical protein